MAEDKMWRAIKSDSNWHIAVFDGTTDYEHHKIISAEDKIVSMEELGDVAITPLIDWLVQEEMYDAYKTITPHMTAYYFYSLAGFTPESLGY